MAPRPSRRALLARAVVRLSLALWPALLALLWLAAAVGAAWPAAPLLDDAPDVAAAFPPHNATHVPLDAAIDGSLLITFTEPVSLTAPAVELVCTGSGEHALTVDGGPRRFALRSAIPFQPQDYCTSRVFKAAVHDHDADDPPDGMAGDVAWSFTAGPGVGLNEVDARSAGGAGDFIELYDGGRGHTDLSGLSLVLYRGDEAVVYLALGLDGQRTDDDGFFVVGAPAVAGVDLPLAADTLRDGPDAVALYAAPEAEFPRNAPLTTTALLDAVVYGPAGAELLALMGPGETALDEDARGAALTDSLQRCPDGGGRPRSSNAFRTNPATPERPNDCRTDAAPKVIAFQPPDGASDVAADTVISVEFDEPVQFYADPLLVACPRSGLHAYTVSGGDQLFRFTPDHAFAGGETCELTLDPEAIGDLDTIDPPDKPITSRLWHFSVAVAIDTGIVINEVDADTPGEDAAEFIELFDGGRGGVALDGLSVVLFNGFDDRAFYAVDLDGQVTDAAGYLLLGSPAVGADVTLPDGTVQNGPDAVVLVAGDTDDFPDGTPVTATLPLDALVYGRSATPDAGLLPLLDAGQPQVDEGGRGAADDHSNQRCPNGAGGARHTAGYKQNIPTPGVANDCLTDQPPRVMARQPARGATGISVYTTITTAFDEPVKARGKWMTLKCDLSGEHLLQATGGPTEYTLTPATSLHYAEACRVTVVAAQVTDKDSDDPPDTMAANESWSFTTVTPPPNFVLINEIDTDTPSYDAAEFIELFDGGVGHTALNGLALVFYNGYDHLAYRAFDLDGLTTDERGFLTLGNVAVTPDLVFPDGLLQNGPDAVALYAGDAAQFPVGAPIALPGLLDAVVYGDPADAPAELLSLLVAGQSAVDEDGRGAANDHALQRCPNGAGGQRQTVAYLPNIPTPDAPSNCVTDAPPRVAATTPSPGDTGVSIYTQLTVKFDEPVALPAAAVVMRCATAGERPVAISGGPEVFRIEPIEPLPYQETCQVTLIAQQISDQDTQDPPDHPAADQQWSFTTGGPPPDFVLINEVDSDTPGSDTAEFIELYNGGRGMTELTGLIVVLFNGSDDRSYLALDLSGERTDSNGYLLIGNAGVAGAAVTLPTGVLQNGGDAVALYAGSVADFPNGTEIVTRGLIDALVYGTDDAPDPGLLGLLAEGQEQVDEAGGGMPDVHSSGRCPNGAGEPRYTVTYRPNRPTPGVTNNCATDAPPFVSQVNPDDGATNVNPAAALVVEFNEPVAIDVGWGAITCDGSGQHTTVVGGGPLEFTLAAEPPLPPLAQCTITLRAAAVHDLDADDPPDSPATDFHWSFTTAAPPPDFVLINEVDADTPGNDTAEFIELFDGGLGGVDLTGLILVFFNGSDDRSYFALDLAGQRTNGDGYFVIGNDGVAGSGLSIPAGLLQNGADAAALYAGDSASFPNGTAVRTQGLIDALVYGTADPLDAGLLALLPARQPQADEAGHGTPDLSSSGRCPNGAGGPRHTTAYRPTVATPSAPNSCVEDNPPTIASVVPPDGATGVAANATLTFTFDEDVALDADWGTVDCESSGPHAAVSSGGPRTFSLSPVTPMASGETCAVMLHAGAIHDLDSDDPPDSPTADFEWSFTIADPPPPPEHILINEIDADTPGSDTAEFIELYDGGVGHTDLTGLAIVLWNGQTDSLLRSIPLDGYQTDTDGYFVIGSASVSVDIIIARGVLQNGPDAIGLYAGTPANNEVGAPLTTEGVIDAIVYGPGDEPDAGLLPLLIAGQPQRDEGQRGAAELHSLQRCPDGAGKPRETAAYEAGWPSPGAANPCPVVDAPPAVVNTIPPDEATGVDPTTTLEITFSEDIAADADWVDVICDGSGAHQANINGGPRAYTLQLVAPLAPGDSCEGTVRSARVHDSDSDDPPDTLTADFTWQFTVRDVEPPLILINEIDADTPGKDQAEFIELYDGGHGHTDLTGLVVVFWNGQGDTAYRAIDLTGHATDAAGYFLLGNPGLAPGLSLPRGALQNGPDAVAIHTGRAEQFPAGTPLTLAGLRDAVVYGPIDAPDEELAALLESGQPQADENAAGAAETHSLQRCPDGAGGPRHTWAIAAGEPTPGWANACRSDSPPTVVAVTPLPDSSGVPLTTTLTITFSEDVGLDAGWYSLTCSPSGDHPATAGGGPRVYHLSPVSPLPADETCRATLHAAAIHDLDAAPPDTMAADYAWSFQLAPAAPPPTAAFTATTPVYIGQSVIFTNTSVGPPPLTYQWDFGDAGPPAGDTHPTHRYQAVGVYTVTLTARHGAAAATYTAVVEVRSRPVLLPVVAR